MNGIERYTKGVASVPVHFPEGKANCRHCTFMRYVDYRKTYYCILSEGYIDISELDRRPVHCPITMNERTEDL